MCQALSERKVPFEIIDLKVSNKFPEYSKVADVREIESLRNSVSGEIVVHLAAVHRDDVQDISEYYNTNVNGTQNIARVCTDFGIKKIIFTSTVAVYGFAEPDTGEDGKINTFNDYGQSKYLAEEQLRSWHNRTDSSLVIVRPTAIFGEGNRGNIFNLFNQIASNNFVMIGDGKNKKSIAYIKNVIAFLEECISSTESYSLYNYVDTPDLDMNSLIKNVRVFLNKENTSGIRLPYWFGILLGYLADSFSYMSGRNLPLSSIRVKKFCSSSAFSSAKFKLNNFKAPFSLDEALEKTLNSEFINPDPNSEIFFSE